MVKVEIAHYIVADILGNSLGCSAFSTLNIRIEANNKTIKLIRALKIKNSIFLVKTLAKIWYVLRYFENT